MEEKGREGKGRKQGESCENSTGGLTLHLQELAKKITDQICCGAPLLSNILNFHLRRLETGVTVSEWTAELVKSIRHSHKGNTRLSSGRIRAINKEGARPPDVRAHEFFEPVRLKLLVVFSFQRAPCCACAARR